MDFYQIKEDFVKNKNTCCVYPDFICQASKDLMVRGNSFYAIWNPETKLWSKDEYDVVRLVDKEMNEYIEKKTSNLNADYKIEKKSMLSYSSNSYKRYKNFVKDIQDNWHKLDSKIIFANTETCKNDYASHKLPYNFEEGDYECYEELMSTLYDPEERQKIEWVIGSIISGDSKKIQKFLVLYGEFGTGKSTVIGIIQKLFEGYYSTFNAKSLASNDSFALEMFKNNPLIAIQHDGDLSRIEDNTVINSIVSHEEQPINEKHKSKYSMKLDAFLIMGTNKPVMISDAKSGIIRRLIDAHPSGRKVTPQRYDELLEGIDYELGAIAYRCYEVYKSLGKSYYNSYKPMDMIFKTDAFFNFVEDNAEILSDGIALKQAYNIYKEYCTETNATYTLQMYKFREELKNYFDNFEDRTCGMRNVYRGFRWDKIKNPKFEGTVIDASNNKTDFGMKEGIESNLDKLCSECLAQYATSKETPSMAWDNCISTLKAINTSRLHYILPDSKMNLIVVDFDKKDDKGNKSFELNVKEASKFPKTYGELSKSGGGIHLYYIYDGDVSMLNPIYDKDIEIKVYNTKGASIRRKLTKCNNLPINHISSDFLPLKEKKGDVMLDDVVLKNDKALHTYIIRAMQKKYSPYTVTSISMIDDVLNKAYESGIRYDCSDLTQSLITFAGKSTHQSQKCLETVTNMKLKSNDESDDETTSTEDPDDSNIMFYDIEVFPNVWFINAKKRGNPTMIRYINPSPKQVHEFISNNKLVGFNNRRYDNHILYAATLGYNNEALYNLSARIVSQDASATFGEAYRISYTDVYDFCSTKQSLKKWEIELKIHHKELGLKWNEPVPESLWQKVSDYCDNDVIATEAVFEANQADWTARKILAEITNKSYNDTTNTLSAAFIFGNNKNPQSEFVYRNMGELHEDDYIPEGFDEYTRFTKDGKPVFPGYVYDKGKSTYRGETVGEGGYVYAPEKEITNARGKTVILVGGMFGRTPTLDISSMHPSSAIAENIFGDRYTQKFKELKDARICVKHGDVEGASKLLDGALVKYLDGSVNLKSLAYALKIVINAVYGLTSARFANPFKDPRNIDNIVAKRGALFMINLKHEVQKRGFTVAHIKTDSIKIVEPTNEILEFVVNYGKMYGYDFEVEHIFEKICLVNNAVYVGKLAEDDPESPGEWTATGTQFQVPYVFKKLFSNEEIIFDDLCETKQVTVGDINIDMNNNPDDPNYIFVGRVGNFCPMKKGTGGGTLYRHFVNDENEDKFNAISGTKGFEWLESETVQNENRIEDIDLSYYDALVDDAMLTIYNFGDAEKFIS